MTLTQDRPAASLHEAARRAMIDSQLRPSGVNEPWVLSAMMALAREDFVPAGYRDAAYMDRAVPLGEGRFLAAPLVHARMLAEAVPTGDDKALLVGDAQGYLAALLRPLVGSLEAIAPADATAKRRGKSGYSLIVVDGAAEMLPDALVAALAEGGRLVTGLVERGVTRLATGRKTGGAFALLPLADIGIPVLSELAAPRRWSF
ncbi:MAG TPA: protein-L-isoaspartate O-methyltransferase [Novosphingobium sp.]|nr:protein-L-isoaspartate O-methyltransferase [Novosphingobium sp.]